MFDTRLGLVYSIAMESPHAYKAIDFVSERRERINELKDIITRAWLDVSPLHTVDDIVFREESSVSELRFYFIDEAITEFDRTTITDFKDYLITQNIPELRGYYADTTTGEEEDPFTYIRLKKHPHI